jgi:hypothetical protein
VWPKPKTQLSAIGILSSAIALILMNGCSTNVKPTPSSFTVISAPTKVLHIPATDLGSRPLEGSVTVRPEAEDEPPEGPQSFDVFDDGAVLVSDPLLMRLVRYDSLGNFVGFIDAKLAASEVNILNSTTISILVASSGERIFLDINGKRVQPPPATRSLEMGTNASVKLTDPQSGTISWVGSRDINDTRSPTISVHLESKDQRMASLGLLSTSRSADTFVAIESAELPGRNLGNLQTVVRRYDASGALETEVRNIPTDFYVVPNTQFRVKSGFLYQLQPLRHEVLINVWSLK